MVLTTSNDRRRAKRIAELHVAGPIVSKKNNLRFAGKSRHPYYDSDTRDNMDGIREQLSKQWSEDTVLDGRTVRTPLPPLEHPALGVVFYVGPNGGRADRDGKLATLLDELVNVGVLRDDSIDRWNGPLIVDTAIRTDGWAGCRVFVEPTGNAARLLRFMRNQDLGAWRAPDAGKKFVRWGKR